MAEIVVQPNSVANISRQLREQLVAKRAWMKWIAEDLDVEKFYVENFDYIMSLHEQLE
jgi:hypothetical protein